jgi:uncharacterized protein YdhG (YjbR/CyaY superfamily)
VGTFFIQQRRISFYPPKTGAIQFPLDQPLPFELMSEMAKYRASESRAKVEAKKKK